MEKCSFLLFAMELRSLEDEKMKRSACGFGILLLANY